MVYMAGDNNLSAAGEADLAELRSVGSSNRVNVLAECDSAGPNGTRRFQIGERGQADIITELGETDSGDPNVLLDFIRWGVREFPAQQYALVLWNHGGGWEPSRIDEIAQEVGSNDFTRAEAAERSQAPVASAFFRTTLQTILSLGTTAERAVCSDDGSHHSLDTVELGRVMQFASREVGRPIDLLGMDACLMSNLEVAYQLRSCVRHVVASEDTEPACGWPYASILEYLTREPHASSEVLAQQVVSAYASQLGDDPGESKLTQTALNLSRVEQVIAPIEVLAQHLTSSLGQNDLAIFNARKQTPRLVNCTLYDLATFCTQLAHETDFDDIRGAAQAVADALVPHPEGLLLSERHVGPLLQGYSGLTAYMPGVTAVSRFYSQLDICHDAPDWAAFIRKYAATQ